MGNRTRKLIAIYAIYNTKHRRYYVGGSVHALMRMQHHRFLLRKGIHQSAKLQDAWNCHQEDDFEYLIVEALQSGDELRDREQYWIDYYDSCNSGYNMQPNAKSSRGYKHSEESRRNMALAHLGKKHSDESKMKRSLALKGRKLSAEHVAKLRAARLRVLQSQQTLELSQ